MSILRSHQLPPGRPSCFSSLFDLKGGSTFFAIRELPAPQQNKKDIIVSSMNYDNLGIGFFKNKHVR